VNGPVPPKIAEVGTNTKSIIVRKGVSIDARDLSSPGGNMKDKIICKKNLESISMVKNIKRRNNSINLK
jgi:hypothetical protein